MRKSHEAKMKLGVCYYPEHWPQSWWAEDARAMAAMGLTYVRIGEFAWSRIEPDAERFEWAWLDAAMDTLHAAGLKVVLGTPTATPPKWLIDRHPDVLAVDARGRARGFGSRRHYCFSSLTYRRETARIVSALAARYANHPGLAAWQTDNEYGCHDTVLSYSADARTAFREWLERKYESVAALNAAWGNVFWSQEYRHFGEIDPPVGTVTEANPSHRLDYARFASDEVVSYNRLQADILRAATPKTPILHNFMGQFFAFDHFAVGKDLDAASWDSYPLGFLEQGPFTDAERLRFLRQGHPDFTAFHHDLYRGVGRGRWWVMEQQPGPVNWAKWNPAPLPGMVRLWTWEAFAHGAEVVSYFRWRQAPFAQEQMHAGLQRPDRAEAPAAAEARQVAREIAQVGAQKTERADVALVWSYEAKWLHDIQPQGADFDQFALALTFYAAARRLGLDVDIVAPDADIRGYRLVLVPSLPILPEPLVAQIAQHAIPAVFGPRSGAKTKDLQIPSALPPGPLAQLLPIKVTRVESLRPGHVERAGGTEVRRWLEHVETSLTPRAATADGVGVWYSNGHVDYIACWPDGALLTTVLKARADLEDIEVSELRDGLRLRRLGGLRFAFNYMPEPVDLSLFLPGAERYEFVLGGVQLPPAGVAAWRD
jgi:beta-galactosidase